MEMARAERASERHGAVDVTVEPTTIYRPRTRPRLEAEFGVLDGSTLERCNDSKLSSPSVNWSKIQMNVADVNWEDEVT